MSPLRTFPVMEVFGPTVQGEGPDAGRPCLFVRFGGCDYRCSWCDSIHAVEPKLVREFAEKLDAPTIVGRLMELMPATGNPDGMTIVLSGGNPALLRLDDLIDQLHDAGFRVTVETQGTRNPAWLNSVDLVVCSPKPPSSGMVTDFNVLERFIYSISDPRKLALKVVVGSEQDYEYARVVHLRYPGPDFFVSVLNPAGSDEAAFDTGQILEGYRQLCERVAADPDMRDARVLPQLHTLAWGAAKGV